MSETKVSARMLGRYGEPDEDAEYAVIMHPLPAVSNVRDQPVHVHHKRIVIVKKDANEIVFEPMLKESHNKIGHDSRWRYVRTGNEDENGCVIFEQGPAVA